MYTHYFNSSTALVGRGLLIVEVTDAPHSVGLPWTSDRPVAETLPGSIQSQETDIHAPIIYCISSVNLRP